jgi:hypothetical protein
MRDAEAAGHSRSFPTWTMSRDARTRTAVASVLVGAVLSVASLILHAPDAAVLVPASVGAAIALAIVPFPAADRLLALGFVATFPLLPPVGLPNLPLSAAVVLIAAARLTFEERRSVSRRVASILAVFWALIAVGSLIADWPPISVMARPAVILALAMVASYVGALVWVDADRRMRWMEGVVLGLLAVTVSAIGVFVLQYLAPIPEIVDRLAALLGYVRGEGAAIKFDARNNWLISGGGVTLRAVSPLVPAPTNLGGYIGVVGPMAAAYWLIARPSRYRTMAGVAAALAVTTGLVTYSRSSWVSAAVAVGAAGLVLLAARRLRHDPTWRPAKRLASGALVIIIAFLAGAVGLATTGSQAAVERVTNASGDPSVAARVNSDLRALGRIAHEPIRGYGLGNWAGVSDEAAAAADPTASPYVHNAYLNFGGATGVLGTAWIAAIVLLLVVSGGVIAVRGSPSGTPVLGVAFVMVGVFTATQFLFDDNLRNPQYAALLAWTLGGGVALADAHRGRPSTAR